MPHLTSATVLTQNPLFQVMVLGMMALAAGLLAVVAVFTLPLWGAMLLVALVGLAALSARAHQSALEAWSAQHPDEPVQVQAPVLLDILTAGVSALGWSTLLLGVVTVGRLIFPGASSMHEAFEFTDTSSDQRHAETLGRYLPFVIESGARTSPLPEGDLTSWLLAQGAFPESMLQTRASTASGAAPFDAYGQGVRVSLARDKGTVQLRVTYALPFNQQDCLALVRGAGRHFDAIAWTGGQHVLRVNHPEWLTGTHPWCKRGKPAQVHFIRYLDSDLPLQPGVAGPEAQESLVSPEAEIADDHEVVLPPQDTVPDAL